MRTTSRLFALLRDVIHGRLTVEEFGVTFQRVYIDDLRDFEVSDVEHLLFSAINERLDLMAKDPDTESRAVGYIDERQFLEWLKPYYGEWVARQ